MTEDLTPLPCPFCGQSAGVMPAGDAGTLIACIMPGCDATAKVYGSTRQEALARWNRRALPSGPVTQLVIDGYRDTIARQEDRLRDLKREADANADLLDKLTRAVLGRSPDLPIDSSHVCDAIEDAERLRAALPSGGDTESAETRNWRQTTTPYRWNGQTCVWEFNEPAFGGWTILRFGIHVSSRPMTFSEGMRHLVLYPLVRGRENETMWLRERIGALEIDYVPAAALSAPTREPPANEEKK